MRFSRTSPHVPKPRRMGGRKQEIEQRNVADQAVYAAEAFLRENSDKVPSDVKTSLDSAVNTLRGALDRNDGDAIARGLEELTQAQHKAAEAMYRTAGAEAAQAPGGAPGGEPEPGEGPAAASGASTDGVIDAEVVDEGKN